MQSSAPSSGLVKWWSSKLTEKNCLILLFGLFLILSIIIGLIPYNPEVDLADATTNDIWVENYSRGIYHIPYDEWDHQPTQSVVVEHDGEYVVVNEKGPGHAMMLVPFYLMGAGFLFGPLMVGLAVFSMYMLGKRLINWRAGILSGVLVLTNVTVLVMWYRYYWTDASTMHLLITSLWLLVEANYWFNGRSLDPRNEREATTKHKLLAVVLGVLSGLAFGASVSTRYPTTLILIAIFIYIFAFYFLRSWPHLKKREIMKAVKGSFGMWVILATFFLGLMCILLPLMQYNTEYFGEPLGSGYDETLVFQFDPDQGVSPRNTSTSWSSSVDTGLSIALDNLGKLLPILITRMPGLLLLPIGFWLMRKNPGLVLLFALIIINFYTYLSLSYVEMYANLPLNIQHEPRYFMPSLAGIALFAGVAVDGLAKWLMKFAHDLGEFAQDTRRVGRAVVCLLFIGLLVLWCIVPAFGYFAHLEEGGALNPRRRPPQIIVANTDQLINDPFRYEGEPVKVENAIVLNTSDDTMIIQSEGAAEPDGITVRFEGWPLSEQPHFEIDDRVEVAGRFIVKSPPNQPQEFFLSVKYDTKDYIWLLP